MSEKATKYRQHAAECRKLAGSAMTAGERQQLIVMAETWEQLALAREQSTSQTPQSAKEQDGLNSRTP